MIYHYDLHIHSILSPDGDSLMTPNNILNMVSIKKLDIISVTDHNSLKQWPVIHEIAESYDFLVIPGVEIHVKEDFHVLCYFKDIQDAMRLDQWIERIQHAQNHMIDTDQGQWITDIYDEPMTQYPYDLHQPLNITLNELINHLKPYEHLLVYAHIDRTRFSGLSVVSSIPLDAVELSKHAASSFLNDHHITCDHVFYNSDAHMITDILECSEKNTIDLDELTMDAFFKRIKHG